MRHNKVTFPILPPPRGGRIRGGGEASPLTPTLSPSTKLGTVSLSNRHDGERVCEVKSDYIRTASQNGSKRLFARLSILFMVVLLMTAPGVMGMAATSCESCHGALDQKNSEPVRLWKQDLHKEAGLGCHDCHGGDPDSMASAMDPSRRFVGTPDKNGSVRLCGGCHSDAGRMPDPTVSTDQLDQYMSGPHGVRRQADRPTCVTCHGSHGIKRITDPSSPVFPTRLARLCIQCHGKESTAGMTGPRQYLEDVHGRARARGTNPRAPACSDCHGAHRAAVPTTTGIQMICGNCHTMEYEYFQAGPHGDSLRLTGEPSCTSCHGYHGIEATGIDEIVGRINDNCGQCHQTGGKAWEVGRKIDENLGVAMSFLGSLQSMSEDLRLSGVETSEMDRLNQEAYGWLLQVESAIHSVDTDWEELTGMAKVKMMAAWDLARDYNLEKGIRRVILLLTAFLAAAIFALLAYKLKLAEKDQLRRQLLGSPEARQREQEHHRK
jgi:hypothetical protein